MSRTRFVLACLVLATVGIIAGCQDKYERYDVRSQVAACMVEQDYILYCDWRDETCRVWMRAFPVRAVNTNLADCGEPRNEQEAAVCAKWQNAPVWKHRTAEVAVTAASFQFVAENFGCEPK